MADSRTNFTVEGVASEDDARTIERELRERRGVQSATVDPESGDVEVRYGEELLSAEAIKSTVRDAGYEVE
ncbi:heavy-metal-associated domain-containing protein [Halegenticoccus soli]|uniref:heavy-metal-associated domain-containing protein n=1 Tax=Halegenticoccus soli TaxID=1985678 RepID=UPI000C6DD76D|nr:heavy-metal-associated domain-containing protein [Halegenticoccus soli]